MHTSVRMPHQFYVGYPVTFLKNVHSPGGTAGIRAQAGHGIVFGKKAAGRFSFGADPKEGCCCCGAEYTGATGGGAA